MAVVCSPFHLMNFDILGLYTPLGWTILWPSLTAPPWITKLYAKKIRSKRLKKGPAPLASKIWIPTSQGAFIV